MHVGLQAAGHAGDRASEWGGLVSLVFTSWHHTPYALEAGHGVTDFNVFLSGSGLLTLCHYIQSIEIAFGFMGTLAVKSLPWIIGKTGLTVLELLGLC